MKVFITFLSCILFQISLNAQEDAIKRLFSDFNDDEDFTSVYVSPKMFEMMLKIEIDDMDQDLKDVLSNIKGLRILSTDDSSSSLFKNSKSKLVDDSFELLMNLREDDQDIEFLVKESNDGKIIEELMMLVGGDDGFTMMSFIGNLDLKKLSRLAKKMNISGLEHLDKLENN